MHAWTDGYVSEITYTSGFYRELAPGLMRYALAMRGYDCPSFEDFTYCELGFGQGLSCNLLAATHAPGRFWGTDFNPEHAAGAQQLARQAGLTNTHWFDESFREFLERDTPAFDFIGLHGIYSWVSEENRQILVEILRRKLKVGGVVYISYNTLPGWNNVIPLRYLLKSHEEALSAPREAVVDKVRRSLDFAARLTSLNAGYFGMTPGLAERIEQIRGLDPHYVVHEYFHASWTPVFFGQMVEALEAAKLSFACSANVTDQLVGLTLPPAVSEELGKIPDPVFRETVRDFCRNTQFRRDFFVRGARPLTPEEQRRRVLDTRFALNVPRAAIGDKVKVEGGGEVSLRADIYPPILDALASGPANLAELLARPGVAPLGFSTVSEALLILIGAGHAAPCLTEAEQAASTASTAAFNRVILEATAAGRQDLAFLASAVLGSGIPVGNAQMLMLRHYFQQGTTDPEAWVQGAWRDLQALDRRMLKDGRILPSEEENLAELRLLAAEFAANALPMLQGLGVA